MMFILHIAILVFGLYLLVKGSEYFVKSSSNFAHRFGISEFIIGLTLVAIGTSIPELATAINAALNHSGGIILGEIIGSNIANMCLIAGLCAMFVTIKTTPQMLKRDGYIMMFAAVMLLMLMLNHTLSKIDGLIFIFLYFAYILFLVNSRGRDDGKTEFKNFVWYFAFFRYIGTLRSLFRKEKAEEKDFKKFKKKYEGKKRAKSRVWKDILIIVISIAAIVGGSRLFIQEALWLRDFWGVTGSFIGIVIVGVGTSLPELIVAIRGLKFGYGDIVVGNIIGSNIANVFLIGGISSIIEPINVIQPVIQYTIPFLLLISMFFLLFVESEWEIKKKEGLMLIVLYIIFIYFVFQGVLHA